MSCWNAKKASSTEHISYPEIIVALCSDQIKYKEEDTYACRQEVQQLPMNGLPFDKSTVSAVVCSKDWFLWDVSENRNTECGSDRVVCKQSVW